MGFAILGALPQRIFGVMTNEVLLAIPLFIFMGVMLERSHRRGPARDAWGCCSARLRGGLGLFPSCWSARCSRPRPGIVGATAVTMGLIMLPAMLRHGYDPRLAAGTVAASATLAQIIPPSTVLVLLGDALNNAYQAAQLAQGQFRARRRSRSATCSPARSCPGCCWSALYLAFLVAVAVWRPQSSPPACRCAKARRRVGARSRRCSRRRC